MNNSRYPWLVKVNGKGVYRSETKKGANAIAAQLRRVEVVFDEG